MTHRMNSRRFAYLGLLGGLLAASALGCGSSTGMGSNPFANCSSPMNSSACASRSQYITTGFLMPPSAQMATSAMYALKLDGDANHGYDNKLGATLAGVSSFGFDAQSVVKSAFNSGQVVFLWQFYGSGKWSPNESPDAIQAFLGKAAGMSMCMPAPDGGAAQDGSCNFFNGMAEFSIASDTKANFFPGATSGAVFMGGQGGNVLTLTFPFMTSGAPLTLNLWGARVTGKVSASGIMQGVLGGGVKISDINQTLIPALTQEMNAIVTQGGGASACTTDASGNACLILKTFDGDCSGSGATCPYTGTASCECDTDGAISPQEVVQNGAIKAFLDAPDLDLFDGCTGKNPSSVSVTDPCVDSGSYNPLKDGVKDSISIGFAFTATTAKIDGAP